MNQFDDIRPYRDEEVRPTINRLLKDKEFLKVIAQFRFPHWPTWALNCVSPLVKYYLTRQTKKIQTVHDLQLIV